MQTELEVTKKALQKSKKKNQEYEAALAKSENWAVLAKNYEKRLEEKEHEVKGYQKVLNRIKELIQQQNADTEKLAAKRQKLKMENRNLHQCFRQRSDEPSGEQSDMATQCGKGSENQEFGLIMTASMPVAAKKMEWEVAAKAEMAQQNKPAMEDFKKYHQWKPLTVEMRTLFPWRKIQAKRSKKELLRKIQSPYLWRKHKRKKKLKWLPSTNSLDADQVMRQWVGGFIYEKTTSFGAPISIYWARNGTE